MKVVNINKNNPNFQSELNISKIKDEKATWRKLAQRFNDGPNGVFDLTSIDNGGIKGQYQTDLSVRNIDFTITPDGVEDLLERNVTEGAIFLKCFEIDLLNMSHTFFNHKHLRKRVEEEANSNFETKYKWNDNLLEKFNYFIAINNSAIANINKGFEKEGISFDYKPINYIRNKINNPQEKNIRIININKRINEIHTEINTLEQEIKELNKKSFTTRLYNKLTGKENIKETIKKSTDRINKLKLTLEVYDDELDILKGM